MFVRHRQRSGDSVGSYRGAHLCVPTEAERLRALAPVWLFRFDVPGRRISSQASAHFSLRPQLLENAICCSQIAPQSCSSMSSIPIVHSTNIFFHEFVVMPDHFHALITVGRDI